MSDLISRQAAIDAVRGYLVGKRCPDDGTLTCRLIENEVINKLPTIHPEHGTNLAEVGTDCISRKAAIEILSQSPFEKVINCISILEEMPSAQPEIIRCKDCKHYGRADKRRFFRGYDCLDGRIASIVPDKDFCSRAERREVTT